jgi:D-inositol-3-phosphate glycosyltransferase
MPELAPVMTIVFMRSPWRPPFGGLWAHYRRIYAGGMTEVVRSIAMVSMHTSPLAPAGSADAGGMNVSILATAIELASRGVEVDLISRAAGAPASVAVAPGVTMHSIAAGPARPLRKSELMRYSDEFGEGIALLADRMNPRYDLIHAHYWLSGIASLPVALELGIPLVQSFHTLGVMKNARLAPGDRPEQEGRLRVETYLANQADGIIAGSRAEASALIDGVHAPADRVWLIPPGVDTELFTPLRGERAGIVRARLGIAASRPIVTVVGRMQPLKGHDLAIRAVAALPEPRPALAIVGDPPPGDEGYALELRRLAADLGIADDVVFVGQADRTGVADLLAASAVTLVPSHSETFGLVALESAASGTPVVGSRSTGLMESVSDGESGVLLSSREPETWAAAIAGLLANPQRSTDLARGARRHAEQFTWGTAAASALGVYASLVASRAAR